MCNIKTDGTMQNKILFEWYSLQRDIRKHFPRSVRITRDFGLSIIISFYLSEWNIRNILCSTFWWTSWSSALWPCNWYSFKNRIYWPELQLHIEIFEMHTISILLQKFETNFNSIKLYAWGTHSTIESRKLSNLCFKWVSR